MQHKGHNVKLKIYCRKLIRFWFCYCRQADLAIRHPYWKFRFKGLQYKVGCVRTNFHISTSVFLHLAPRLSIRHKYQVLVTPSKLCLLPHKTKPHTFKHIFCKTFLASVFSCLSNNWCPEVIQRRTLSPVLYIFFILRFFLRMRCEIQRCDWWQEMSQSNSFV